MSTEVKKEITKTYREVEHDVHMYLKNYGLEIHTADIVRAVYSPSIKRKVRTYGNKTYC